MLDPRTVASLSNIHPREAGQQQQWVVDEQVCSDGMRYKSRILQRKERRCALLHFRTPALRTSLWLAVALLLGLFLFDLAVCVAAPCEFYDIGSKAALLAGRCVEEYELIVAVKLVCLLLSLALGSLHNFHKVLAAVRISGSTCFGYKKLGSGERRRGFGRYSWVCVASPDLYEETIDSLRAGNILIGLTITVVTAVLMCAFLAVGIEWYYDGTRVLIKQVCGSNVLCQTGKHFNEAMWGFVIQVWAAISIQLITTPSMLFGPTAKMAFARTAEKATRHRRLHRTPYFAILSLLMVGYQNLQRELRDTPNDPDAAAEVGALFVTQLFFVTVHIGLLWNSMLLQDTAAFLHNCVRQLMQRDGQRRSDPFQLLRGASSGQQRDVLIMLLILVFVYRVVTGVAIIISVVIYTSRVVLIALIVFVQDKEASFDNIQASPAFGLVVAAKPLRQALAASLGQTDARGGWRWWGEGSQPKAPASLPLYKATLERMQETLAVSYRWQAEEVELCVNGAALNMSEFQRRSVMDAIDKLGPMYVWLDRFSVPQESCSLKWTLLARMMAVYSAASATVAIQSVELPGNRYHERVWTCQEFCSAQKLQVRTQETEWAGEGEEAVAVHEDEAREFEALRRTFQEDEEEVVPLWLRIEAKGAMSVTHAKAVLAKYRSLAERLHSKVPSDKIRALLPLLARTPVESQEELRLLVEELGRAAGENVGAWAALLRQSYRWLDESSSVSGPRESKTDETGSGDDENALRTTREICWLLPAATLNDPASNGAADVISEHRIPIPTSLRAEAMVVEHDMTNSLTQPPSALTRVASEQQSGECMLSTANGERSAIPGVVDTVLAYHDLGRFA